MSIDLGDVWVCTDCYFAHHYGIRATVMGTDHLDPQPVPLDEVPGLIADGWTVTWWAGDSDIPCDSEPLSQLDGLDLYDNTCSNHSVEDVYDDDGDRTGDTTECPECGHDDWEDGITDFSWSRCGGCGSMLGGSRYRLHVEKP